MISLMVFVEAVIVSILLERQGRRHSHELAQESLAQGLDVPLKPAGVSRSTGVVHIILGVGFLAFGAMGLYAYYLIRTAGESIRGEYFVAIFFAVGVLLITAGVKGVRSAVRGVSSRGR